MRICALLLVVSLPLAVAAEDQPGEFRPLLTGQSLAGWVAKTDEGQEMPADSWSVVEGNLTAQAGTGWLSTKEMYGDFVLRLEWRIPENGNSGVFIRVPDLKKGERPHIQGIEIQVLDDKGSQYAGKLKPWQFSGSIYGAVPAENSTFKGHGEWNSYVITCRGSKIEVAMNGKLVAAGDADVLPTLQGRPRRGYIGLQNHGSGVEYRKIEIKTLE